MWRTRTSSGSSLGALGALGLVALGIGLGTLHARAWGLGDRTPVLSFDAAQYALAARTLATTGSLATPFALPIDLALNTTPPWPLSVVQPGLVVLEAALDRIVPAKLPGMDLSAPERREWLPLVISFGCYLALGLLLARALRSRLEAFDPGRPGHTLVALAAGVAFLLDPEAQHLALGGFTELPFTLAFVAALVLLANGWASRRPLAWGLLLGAACAIRGQLAALAPLLAVAAALAAPDAPRSRRVRIAALVLVGALVPLAPWWIYKWRAFGTPMWDLSALAIWDGAGNWTWFSLTHRAEFPDLATGPAAAAAIVPKVMRNLAALSPVLATGMAGIGSLALALALAGFRRPAGDADPARAAAARAARITIVVLLLYAALALAVAAVGAGWRRYLFPARVPIEAAGLAAVWLWLAPFAARTPRLRYAVPAALAAVMVLWGGIQTLRGLDEARGTGQERGLPTVATLHTIVEDLDHTLRPGEVVMSNLGPTLAWYAGRPVLHLALGPADVDACRSRVAFRCVVLAFRDPARAWTEWAPLVANPNVALSHPEWHVFRTQLWLTDDGFRVVRLDLSPR